MIVNRVAVLMRAEISLTVAISHAQRARVNEMLLGKLLEAKRDVVAERTAIEDAEAQRMTA